MMIMTHRPEAGCRIGFLLSTRDGYMYITAEYCTVTIYFGRCNVTIDVGR